MTSIFAADKKASELFTRYQCSLRFTDKILGGIPKNPKTIEGWIRSQAGVDSEEEIKQMMLRTLIDLGAEVTPEMSYEELTEASEKLAAVKQTNGFKINSQGLYIEDRQVKAMIKEAVAILYPWGSKDSNGKDIGKWGVTKKAARSYLAETVFVNPAQINLCKDDEPVREPDGTEMMIIHASGPRGKVNSLSYSEYVENAELSFYVDVLRDSIQTEYWPEIWVFCEQNGLGASRSQSYGKFEVTQWDKI